MGKMKTRNAIILNLRVAIVLTLQMVIKKKKVRI